MALALILTTSAAVAPLLVGKVYTGIRSVFAEVYAGTSVHSCMLVQAEAPPVNRSSVSGSDKE